MTELLELSHKEHKEAIIQMFQQAITNMLQTQESIQRVNKETEDMKRNQMEILEMKTIVTQIKRTQWMSLTAE